MCANRRAKNICARWGNDAEMDTGSWDMNGQCLVLGSAIPLDLYRGLASLIRGSSVSSLSEGGK